MSQHDTQVLTDRRPPDRTLQRWMRYALTHRRRAVVLGPGLIITILVALAIVGVIIGNQAGWFAAIRSGGDHVALQNNIDQVAASADRFWAEHASDQHGRRKIDLVRFCNFANNQWAGEAGLTIRTLAVIDATIADEDQEQTNSAANTGEAALMLPTSRDGTTAHCPTSSDKPGTADAGQLQVGSWADIIVGTTATPGLAAPSTALTGSATTVAHGTTAAAAPSLSVLEDVGLASSRAVWIAQFTGLAVPPGTDRDVSKDNEVLVFGGVAADGVSFCLVKVFDADDRTKVGDYRYSKDRGDAATHPFAICGDGVGTPGMVQNAGWPEAR